MKTARDLIARSISHNEIVTAEWSPDIAAELQALCLNSVAASDTLAEYWGGTDGDDEWRVHLTGIRANPLRKIRIESSHDAGVDWTNDDHGRYCAEVERELGLVFPGVRVECEPSDVMETRVRVSGEHRSESVTVPAPEDALVHSIREIMQDVWDTGAFWDLKRQLGLDSDGNVTGRRCDVVEVNGHVEMFSRDGARWVSHVYGPGGAEGHCDESDVPDAVRQALLESGPND